MKRWRWLAQDLWANGLASSPLVPASARYRLLALHRTFNISKCVIQANVRWWGGSRVVVGAGSFINRECVINHSGEVRIGSNVAIGPGCMILTATHEVGPSRRRSGRGFVADVVIQDGVWLGARVTVMPGVTIGRGTVIGANSLIINDCDADSLYVGSPARKIRELKDE